MANDPEERKELRDALRDLRDVVDELSLSAFKIRDTLRVSADGLQPAIVRLNEISELYGKTLVAVLDSATYQKAALNDLQDSAVTLRSMAVDLSDITRSANYIARQRAAEQVAKADPRNIQEVAASQLEIINTYYQSGLQQSQQSFRWSLIWGGIGLVFLMGAIGFLLLRQPINVAVLSGIGGAIVEAIAATYLYLYKHASDQLAAFQGSLESNQRLLLANSLCENLKEDVQQKTRAELVQKIADSIGYIQTVAKKQTERGMQA